VWAVRVEMLLEIAQGGEGAHARPTDNGGMALRRTVGQETRNGAERLITLPADPVSLT